MPLALRGQGDKVGAILAYAAVWLAAFVTLVLHPTPFSASVILLFSLVAVLPLVVEVFTIARFAGGVWLFALLLDHSFRAAWGVSSWMLAIPALALGARQHAGMVRVMGGATVLYLIAYTAVAKTFIDDANVRNSARFADVYLEATMLAWCSAFLPVVCADTRSPLHAHAAQPGPQQPGAAAAPSLRQLHRHHPVNPLASPTVSIGSLRPSESPLGLQDDTSNSEGDGSGAMSYTSSVVSSARMSSGTCLTPDVGSFQKHASLLRTPSALTLGPPSVPKGFSKPKVITVLAVQPQQTAVKVRGAPVDTYRAFAHLVATAEQCATQERGILSGMHGDRLYASFHAFQYSPRHADHGLRCVRLLKLQCPDVPMTCAVATGNAFCAAFPAAGGGRWHHCIVGPLTAGLERTLRLACVLDVGALCTDGTERQASKSHEVRACVIPAGLAQRERYYELLCRYMKDAKDTPLTTHEPTTPNKEWMYVYDGSVCKTWLRYNEVAALFAGGRLTDVEMLEQLENEPEEVRAYARDQLEQHDPYVLRTPIDDPDTSTLTL